MKKYHLGICLFICACSSGGSVTTMDAFYEVPIGASQEEVVAQLGEPVRIGKCEDGSTSYVYIERFKRGARNVETRSYYIVMKDGKVVPKQVKQESPPAFDYRTNSYHMQTTQNSSDNP